MVGRVTVVGFPLEGEQAPHAPLLVVEAGQVGQVVVAGPVEEPEQVVVVEAGQVGQVVEAGQVGQVVVAGLVEGWLVVEQYAPFLGHLTASQISAAVFQLS